MRTSSFDPHRTKACNIAHMEDPRTRNVDAFDAPEDYGDPWRGRRTLILLVSSGALALVILDIVEASAGATGVALGGSA
jgi:hypothetical protein